GVVDLGEGLARSVVGQQVSVAAARTHLARLVDALGERVGDRARDEEGLDRLFPTPDALAGGAAEIMGGPRSRIDALVRASAALADGTLDLDVGEPRESFVASLTALPGIGPWTADLLAMRYLGSSDVLLA